MRRSRGWSQLRDRLWVTAATVAASSLFAADEGQDTSRYSDQPAPLQLQGFPERPPPLVEWGDKFLGTGNLQRGFTLPTGEVWSPDFWLYGTLRTALQSFDPGGGPRVSEWANRLDLFGNLQLSPTERVLVGFRPLDRNGVTYSGYTFQPRGSRGFLDASSATPRTLFFEGELGELFPKLDESDRRSLDYGFAAGRQPLTLQDGILVNDNSVDMISVTRNALLIPGGSTLRLSAFFAWDQIERPNYNVASVPNQPDHDARMVGLDAAADFPVSTVEADAIYVSSSPHDDGFYAGLGSIQRLGKFNTTFRAVTSVAVDGPSSKVSTGSLFFSQLSYTMPYSEDLLYLDGFCGIDHFTSPDRDPTAGGPLGQIGIMYAAVGLGQYGAPLNNQADHSAGGALGYQMFFGEYRRRLVILEIGGRAPTETPGLLRQQAAEGVAVRFQQALGRRFVLVVDGFGVNRNGSSVAGGGRSEVEVKF
jgi:hypothetical protein